MPLYVTVEPELSVGVVGVSPPWSWSVPPSSMVKVEPHVKVWPFKSNTPSTTVHVWPEVVSAVDKEAALLPVLFTDSMEEKVPVVFEMVWAAEPENSTVKLAPPKVVLAFWAKLPVTESVLAAEGLATVPDVRVNAPTVQLAVSVQFPLDLLTVTVARVAEPQLIFCVESVFVNSTVPPLAVKVPELVKLPIIVIVPVDAVNVVPVLMVKFLTVNVV